MTESESIKKGKKFVTDFNYVIENIPILETFYKIRKNCDSFYF